MNQHSATPIILLNLNLPPEIRHRKQNIICPFIIPGPTKYKDLDSFLQPLVDELNALGHPDGINTYSAYQKRHFGLRAYAVLFSGDGPAISEAIGMKAPGNAIKPCRFCEVTATKAPNNHWYVPHPKAFSATTRRLRLRTNLRETLELATASGAGDIEGTDHTASLIFKARLILLGITRRTILLDLPTLHFPRSFAIDLMHCILINIVQTLWDIWTAEHFKNDDMKNASDDNYLFSKKELDIFDGMIQDRMGNQVREDHEARAMFPSIHPSIVISQA